jgi:hypothetical protein
MLAIEEYGLALEMFHSIEHMPMLFYQLNHQIISKIQIQMDNSCIFIPSGS